MPTVSTTRRTATPGLITADWTNPLTASTSLLSRETMPPVFSSPSSPSGSDSRRAKSRPRRRKITFAFNTAVRYERVESIACFTSSSTTTPTASPFSRPGDPPGVSRLMIVLIASGQTRSSTAEATASVNTPASVNR